MKKKLIRPIILTILDGWGYSNITKGNAIKLANTPTLNNIWKTYPYTLLTASGEDVGLPSNQMGNSEVGHTTIGAGRIINQDLVRINKSIETNTFFKNLTLHNILKKTINKQSKIHIIGLCSDGGIHSHINHLLALINITKKYLLPTCLHLITDGRDTDAKAAKYFINQITKEIKEADNIKICTISGRYYSMDRDCRWSRTEKAYKTLIENQIHSDLSSLELLDHYYNEEITDEFIPPTRINKGAIENKDSIIFFNFRPDRTKQLLHSLIKKTFKGFNTREISDLNVVTFTQYDASIKIPLVFPPKKNKNFLGEVISSNGLKQLRLAETEKYAHVTYFLNGGIEEPLPGEDRELISSPKVDTYDLAPEMSAHKLTDSIIKAINKNIYQVIIINYANPDMVGHTGNLEATIKAINTVDLCIKNLLNTVQKVQGTLIITADHGNAECMLTETHKPCKSHTTNTVPFSLIKTYNNLNTDNILRKTGSLADVAPTILDLLNIPVPKEMTGASLLNKVLPIKS